MPTLLAILAAATVATGRGGVPDTHACVNRRSIPHLHTPCSPNRHTDEQIDAATNGTQAAVGPPHPLGTHPSILNLTDGWQVDQMAGRGPHPPIPTALQPARAVPSIPGAQGATYEPTVPACDPSPKPTESRASPPTHDVPMCPSSAFLLSGAKPSEKT